MPFHSVTRLTFTARSGSARLAASVEGSQFGIATRHAEKSAIARSIAARTAASTFAFGSEVVGGAADAAVVEVGVVDGVVDEVGVDVVVSTATDVVVAETVDSGAALSSELHAARSRAPLRTTPTQRPEQRSQQTQLVVLGYPRLFMERPRLGDCQFFSNLEQTWANGVVADLNKKIARAVQRAGGRARFVDTYNAFEGGELCRGSVQYVNPIGLPKIEYSLHPTMSGHARLAALLSDTLNPGRR